MYRCFPICLCVHHMSLKARRHWIMDGCELPYGFWDLEVIAFILFFNF